MSAVDKLEKKLGQNLNRHLNPTHTETVAVEGEEPKGNPLFDVLLQKLLDIVLGLLDGCLVNNRSPEDVTEAAMKPGILQRYVIRKAVKKSSIDAEHRAIAERSIMDTMTDNSATEVRELVDELGKVTPDWNAW